MTSGGLGYVLADVELARRLERAEARSNADFIEARALVSPERHAAWIEVAGAYAMFDGVESPLTQTFGVGVFQPLAAADLDRIERFYRDRAAPIHHEVSPLADPSVLSLLNERLYRPIEFTSVMSRRIERNLSLGAEANTAVVVRVASAREGELWARTAAKGWSDAPDLANFVLSLAQVSARRANTVSFLAEIEGRPIGAGSLSIHDGVALLAGASTISEARGRGAQRALLQARLCYAAEQGCDLAMMCAQPGSASQRNAERQGFRIAYTRIKWSARTTSE